MSGAAAPVIAGLGGYLASLGIKGLDEVFMHPVKQGVKQLYGDDKNKQPPTDLRVGAPVGQAQQPMQSSDPANALASNLTMPASSPALPIVGQAAQMATQEPQQAQGQGLMGGHPIQRGIGNGILAMASLGLGQDPMKVIAQQQQMAMQEKQMQRESAQHQADVQRETAMHQADQQQRAQEYSQGLAQDQAKMKQQADLSAADLQVKQDQFKQNYALDQQKLGIDASNAKADQAYRTEQTALAKQQADKTEMQTLMAAHTALQQGEAMGTVAPGTASQFLQKHAALRDYLGASPAVPGEQAQAQAPQSGTIIDQMRTQGVSEGEIHTIQAMPPDQQMTAASHAMENAGTQSRLGQNNAAQMAGKVSDDYRADKITQNYATIGNFHQNIEAMKAHPSGFSDMTLLYSYGHTVDPASVVREGEMQMYANAGSIWDRVRATANKVFNGQKLSDNERADLIQATDAMWKAQTERYRANREHYVNTAKNVYKVPEENINDLIPDYSQASAQEQQQGAGPAVGTVVGGFKFKGGNPNDKNSWEPVQ